MQIGNRIIYDQDGQIIYQIGEMQGDVLPRKDITELNYIDLESRMQIEAMLLASKSTIIFVEHDEFFQDKIATKRIEL